MSEAEFYKDLLKRTQQELSIRLGTESNINEFQNYISAATNPEKLEVAWDNSRAERILVALIDGLAANPASRLNHILLYDDLRPINTKRFDFVGLLVQLARRSGSTSTIQKIQLGHNNYGESWWLTLQNREREQILDLNELVFPCAFAYETFLAGMLDATAKDGVSHLDLYLCMMTNYLTYDGISRIFEIIGGKFFSLQKLSLKMMPRDNDFCEDEEIWDRDSKPFPYDVVISAIADAIGNCPEIKEIDIELGTLTTEHENASRKLADAILKSESLCVKRKVRLECWVPKFCPWTTLPDKEWIEIPDSESDDGDY